MPNEFQFDQPVSQLRKIADPWASQPGGNPFPVILSPNVAFPNNGQIVNFPLRPKPTYQNQWNLSLQRQIGKDWMVSSNDVGSSVIHLWGGGEQNPGIYFPSEFRGLPGATRPEPVAEPQRVCSTGSRHIRKFGHRQYSGSFAVTFDKGLTRTFKIREAHLLQYR